uniref:Terpene synthase 3 n=1 Tax=Paeonia delavayi TaxID=40707 RepID=A0A9E8G7R5_9MAGN|nr:terpene synthase 3 [Paeonia delavayi]
MLVTVKMAGIRSISIPLHSSSPEILSNFEPLPSGSPRLLSQRAFPQQRRRSWFCMSQSDRMPPITHHDPLPKPLPLHHTPVLQSQTKHLRRKTIEELQERTQKELQTSSDPVVTLKLIDTLQQLGIAYHFKEDINKLLERFSEYNSGDDLFVTALRFRLLRHNGFPTCSGIFDKFINKKGRFKETLSKDTWGLLSLYEASYLGAKGEVQLLQAMEFTKTHLMQSKPTMTAQLSEHVARSLEIPRHLRMERLEARNYIDEYSRGNNCSMALLELARLDFDMVQSLHQKELEEIFRWWKQLGLVDKLSFGRDRPMECFLWTVGIFPEPCQSRCRIELTKTIAILLVIDDIFDTYGSLNELILFTDAIKRWNLGAMEQLPDYMKICYMTLHNTTNDIAYWVLKEHGLSNIIPYLKRTWIEIIEAFLIEAKWFDRGYVPTFDEYLANGVISGGTCMALVHAFFLMGQGVMKETEAMMEPYPRCFTSSGKILRLWDDLGTSREEQERGDVASSIECLMKEKNIALEDGARKYVRQLIGSLWIELNGELVAPTGLPLSTIKASFNLSRTAQAIYQHGNDNTTSSVQHHVQSLFFSPIGFNVTLSNI